MTKLTDWIRRHQVAAFFIITFAITWGLGFSYVAVYQGMYLLLPLGFGRIGGWAQLTPTVRRQLEGCHEAKD